MVRFEWDPALETGCAEVDNQHKGLYDLANALERAIDREGEEGDENAVADAVYGLVDYVTQHFQDEENLMAECHYPGLVPHRSLHEQLSAETLEVMARYVNGELHAPKELAPLVCDWLNGHIQQHDVSVVKFMESSRPAAPSAPPAAPL